MQPGAVIGGRYRVVRLAGTGGMASVFQAVELATERPVAVKLARLPDDDPEPRRRRFDREAGAVSDILAQLSHPGLLAYLDHGVADTGQPYLVMEWLDGHDLQARLRERPLTVAETVTLGRRVASALAAVHQRGLVHRDLKPSNLFLVAGDVARVKLIDFGVARVDDGGAHTTLTRAGNVLGTPSYMAPEQARGEPDVDGRADLYALGAVLFACLIGRPPFVGDHPVAMLAKMHFEQPPRVRTLRQRVPRALDQLIAGLLAKDRAQRLGSAAEVVSLLHAIADGSTEHSGEVPVAAVSGDEQRYLSVLLIGHDPFHERPHAETAMRELADAHGGEFERLDDDTLAVLFAAGDDAGQSAVRAARFALAVRARCAGAPIVIATGRGQITGPLPVGEAVDRAVELLVAGDTAVLDRRTDRGRRLPIVVCDLSAALLEPRFVLARDERPGRVLVSERVQAAERRLLGRSTPCVGRTRQMRTLAAVLDECVDDSVARVVLVTGPPGAGKSRLARELIAEFAAGDDPPGVLTAHGDPMRASSPFAMVAQLILQAAGIVEHDAADARRDKLARHLDERLSATPGIAPDEAERDRATVFLGELCGVSFPDHDRLQLREARREPQLMHDQLGRAWNDWLAAETAHRPVALILDDLQWSDPPSVKFVDAALRHLADSPLLVLALARPEVDEAFPELWVARDVDRIPLRPLGKRACAAIARAAMPAGVSEATVDRLIERAGGNPFYLEELLRAAAAGQLDELPGTVLATVGARLAALPASDRRVLRAASVFGRTFWHGGLVALLGDPPDVVRAFVGRLLDREIVVAGRGSRFADTPEYGFVHDLAREAAYASLPDDDRVLAHFSAGVWLHDHGETDPVVLAAHFHRGEAPDRALPFYHRAAEQALAADHLAAAIDHAERAIACGAEGETLGALRLLQAEAHNWRREFKISRTRGEEALALLPPGGPAWAHAAHQLAWAGMSVGELKSVEPLGEALVRHAPSSIEGWYLGALANCFAFFCTNRREELAARIRRLIEQNTDPTDPHSSALIAVAGYFAAEREGDLCTGVQLAERAVLRFSQVGNRRSAIVSTLNRTHFLRRLGLYEQVTSVLAPLIPSMRRIDLPSFAADAQLELAAVHVWSGAWSDALSPLCEFDTDELDPVNCAFVHIYRARVSIAMGRAENALWDADRALELVSESCFPDIVKFGLALRAQAMLELHRPNESLRTARSALGGHHAIEYLGEGDALAHRVHAEALHACGDVAAARRAIAAARDRLLGHASLIDVPEWKTSFLERVYENRRTLELAREWLDE